MGFDILFDIKDAVYKFELGIDWQLISWISEIDRFDAPWTFIERRGTKTQLSPKEKSILTFIGNHPGCKSGDIAKKLGIPNPTVKRILSKLLEINLIKKYGTGPGTNYSIK